MTKETSAILKFIPFIKDFFIKNIDKNSNILEIGCGDGDFARLLETKHSFKIIHKCDIEKHNKYIENFKYVDLNDQNLPYIDNTMDFVYSCFVMEHLENIYHYVRETKRVLKKGCDTLVFIPSADTWYERLNYLIFGESTKYRSWDVHINYLTDRILIKAFEKYGFKLKERFYSYGLIPILRIKLPRTRLFGLKKGYLFTLQ